MCDGLYLETLVVIFWGSKIRRSEKRRTKVIFGVDDHFIGVDQ